MDQYIRDLKRSKFVVSPPGKGQDCHRTWEAILFGAIPIVENSTGLWPLFRESPIFVINDWKAPVNLTDFLNFRAETTTTFGREVVLADFWFKRINKFRKKV